MSFFFCEWFKHPRIYQHFRCPFLNNLGLQWDFSRDPTLVTHEYEPGRRNMTGLSCRSKIIVISEEQKYNVHRTKKKHNGDRLRHKRTKHQNTSKGPIVYVQNAMLERSGQSETEKASTFPCSCLECSRNIIAYINSFLEGQRMLLDVETVQVILVLAFRRRADGWTMSKKWNPHRNHLCLKVIIRYYKLIFS